MKIDDSTVLVTGANRGLGQALVKEALSRGAKRVYAGAVDILVNNTGISFQNDLSDRAALEQLLAVNLFGTYDVTQAFLPVLARSGGAIVNEGLTAED